MLRERIFFRNINDAIDTLRKEMCDQYKVKTGNRFFVEGITYEIGEGIMSQGGVHLEISSKIPQEIFHQKGLNKKYFKEVKSEMNAQPKKPLDIKMENIIRSTNVNEIKERDYVKCIYDYQESELYLEKDVDEIVQDVINKKLKLPTIMGVTTLPGRAVIYKMKDSIYNFVSKNIHDLIKANETVMKKYVKLDKQQK